MRFFGKTNIDFMSKRKLWYTISLTIIGLGMISLLVKGVDYGVDFLGGTELIVRFKEPVEVGDIRAAMGKAGFDRAEIKYYGSDREVLLRTTEQGTGSTIAERVRETLKQNFANNPYVVLKEDKIGPKIGAELRTRALWAMLWSLIAIMLYVGFRFKFIYGVGAVVALFHDVLVAIGLVSIFDGITPGFNLEIDQNMVAALLTLVGLSVNDTVVIFDRIRENQKIFKSMGLIQVINKSINETLSRTVITQGTVFAVLMVLLIFGGEVNRGFAFALTVGILMGTYSSVYIASAVVVEWANRTNRKAKLIN